MRPTNAIIFLEQKHSDMYAFFAKKPNVGRGLFFVCGAVSALAPVVKFIARLVETLALLVINLVGAIFDPKLLDDAKICAKAILYAPVGLLMLIRCPLNAIHTLFMMILNPKSHSEINRSTHQFFADSHRLFGYIGELNKKTEDDAMDAISDRLIKKIGEKVDKPTSTREILDSFSRIEKLRLKTGCGPPPSWLWFEFDPLLVIKVTDNKSEMTKKERGVRKFYIDLKDTGKRIEDIQSLIDLTIADLSNQRDIK